MPALQNVIRHLGTLARRDEQASDGDLLSRFVQAQDERAFETLVRRHGPLILGVCRRLLQHRQDAEDAFQATFLVLVQRARGIRKPGSLASWLYGVARRTALMARKASQRRRLRESQIMPKVDEETNAPTELTEDLDQALAELPEAYRAAILLCDLEGKSLRQAAEELGCPVGTVASRLARGRTLLKKYLTHQDVSLGLGIVTTSLICSTVRAASLLTAGQTASLSMSVFTLMKGVLKTMMLAKLKTGAGALLLTALVGLSGTAVMTPGLPTVTAQTAGENRSAKKEAVGRDQGAADPTTKEKEYQRKLEQLELKLQEALASAEVAKVQEQVARQEAVVLKVRLDLLQKALADKEREIQAFKQKNKQPEPPSLQKRGTIKDVDKSGLVLIELDQKEQVQTGDQLLVYRTEPMPRYLGRLRVVDMRAGRAVARFEAAAGQKQAELQVGDHVAAEDQGK